jgi:putative transposase
MKLKLKLAPNTFGCDGLQLNLKLRILLQQEHIKRAKYVCSTERFLYQVTKKYGEYPISTDGGTWYPQACKFLKLKHHIHSSQEKSSIERTMQYIKDRTESFDDYFPCMKKRYKLKHVPQWHNLFADYYNRGTTA